MKHQRGHRVGVQFAPFLAVQVGVENESPLIDTLEQHHTGIGRPIGIDGRQRHGGGVARFCGSGLLQPGGKQANRIVRGGEITTR